MLDNIIYHCEYGWNTAPLTLHNIIYHCEYGW
jgi:hypothetical protein